MFLAYDSQDSQTLNNKVEQGLDYFVKNGKVESGVHSIVGFTHAAFVLGSGKWNEVEGGQFQEIEEHLAFLKRNYVAKGLLEFVTASQLVEKIYWLLYSGVGGDLWKIIATKFLVWSIWS